MIYESKFADGESITRRELGGLQARAESLMQILPALDINDADILNDLFDQLSLEAAKRLGGLACGVSASVAIGFSAGSDTAGDILDDTAIPFIGVFDKTEMMLSPKFVFARANQASVDSALVPGLVFDPVDPDDLPRSMYSQYAGLATLYHRVGIPLIGPPVLCEALPICTTDSEQ